jgi:hypothetical protein
MMSPQPPKQRHTGIRGAAPPQRTIALVALAVFMAPLIMVPGCQRPRPRDETQMGPAAATKPPEPRTRSDAASGAGKHEDEASADANSPQEQAEHIEYLKGTTHVHTIHSGDSQTPVADVVRWYAEHEYDFIVITDHNRVIAPGSHPELMVIPGVELTHNPGTCLPAPPAPGGRCRIHVNSLFVDLSQEVRLAARTGREPGTRMDWRERTSKQRVDMYQRALERSAELEGIAQINHPTWHWGVDGALLAELGRRGAVLVEVANQAFARWNPGTESYPSAEAIWDEALSAGVVIWGVASDDAHHYHDAAARMRRAASMPPERRSPVYPAGTGFVMVRAERDPAAIRQAVERGEFYGSTGVLLSAVERVSLNGEQGRLTVVVKSPDEHEIAFIGTRDGKGGQMLRTERGQRASYTLQEPGYVRAVVTDAEGRKAWVQPVFVR